VDFPARIETRSHARSDIRGLPCGSFREQLDFEGSLAEWFRTEVECQEQDAAN
jgi:hypothetical protein